LVLRFSKRLKVKCDIFKTVIKFFKVQLNCQLLSTFTFIVLRLSSKPHCKIFIGLNLKTLVLKLFLFINVLEYRTIVPALTSL
jgi:hypothetical protein